MSPSSQCISANSPQFRYYIPNPAIRVQVTKTHLHVSLRPFSPVAPTNFSPLNRSQMLQPLVPSQGVGKRNRASGKFLDGPVATCCTKNNAERKLGRGAFCACNVRARTVHALPNVNGQSWTGFLRLVPRAAQMLRSRALHLLSVGAPGFRKILEASDSRIYVHCSITLLQRAVT